MFEVTGLQPVPVDATETQTNLSSAPGLPPDQLQIRLLEFGAIYFALFAIDFFFFSKFGDFFTLSPHPFWIPVLLFSLQYGFADAISAAASAIVLNWLFLIPEQVLGEPYFHYIVRNSMTPALWLCVALIVCELRQRQIREHTQFHDELQQLRAQTEVLSKHCTETKQANLDLQLLIAAGKTAPLEHALMQLGVRQSGDVQDYVATFENALESLIGPHKASVFVTDETTALKLSFQFGWVEDDCYRRKIQPDHPLYRAVIAQGQFVSWQETWGGQVFQGEGKVAIPIRHIHQSEAFGMLKIEEAGSDIFSPEKLKALVLLGREMGIFLEQFSLAAHAATPAWRNEPAPLQAAV